MMNERKMKDLMLATMSCPEGHVGWITESLPEFADRGSHYCVECMDWFTPEPPDNLEDYAPEQQRLHDHLVKLAVNAGFPKRVSCDPDEGVYKSYEEDAHQHSRLDDDGAPPPSYTLDHDLSNMQLPTLKEEFCSRCGRGTEESRVYETLSLDFLELMDDIGKYGVEKYKERSFEARRAAGKLERDGRTLRPIIIQHAHQHASDYIDGIKHDWFGTEEHQLAAAAFNLMMEYIFTKEGR